MTTLLESDLMGQDIDRERIRTLRDKKGLSQTEAARQAGIGGGAAGWSDIENGWRKNVTLETLSRIAEVLGVDARTLITPRAKGKK